MILCSTRNVVRLVCRHSSTLFWLVAPPSLLWRTVNTKRGVTFYGIRRQVNKDSVTGGAARNNREIKTTKTKQSQQYVTEMYNHSQFCSQVTVHKISHEINLQAEITLRISV